MPRYVVNQRYGSMRDGKQWGPWQAGLVIDLSEADAEWLNTDSPGVLSLEVEPEPEPPLAKPVETKLVETKASPKEPQKNRMNAGGGPNRAA